IVAVIMMKLLKRFDQQIVNRKPNRAAPVGVAAKNSTLRLGRFVIHDFGLAAHGQHVWMVLVISAHGTNTVVTEEFVRVEHPPEQPFPACPARDRDQAAWAPSRLLPTRD